MADLKYRLLKSFLLLFTLIPFKRSQQIGGVLGRVLLKFNRKRAHIARCNLKACFPEKTEAEREALLVKVAEETGKWMMEAPHIWLGEPAIMSQYLHAKNPEVMHEAISKQKGVVVILPHLGNWEMINFHFPQNYPGASIYKPIKSSTMERIILENRTKLGGKLFKADNQGIRQSFKHLAKGKVMVLLADHLPSRQAGVYAPFFGVRALTGKFAHTLARRRQSEVVMLTILRKEDGEGFELEFHPVDGLHTDDEVEAATHLNAAIERVIRIAPEQYQWVYTRFDKQPKGEKTIYH